MFGKLRSLEAALIDKNMHWIICEIDGHPTGVIALKKDQEQGLCKIHRMLVDPETAMAKLVLKELLRFTLNYIRQETSLDVIYTTTLSLSMEQIKVTSEEGFKVLGVFPNALGEDKTQLNGLTAFYHPGVLQNIRDKDFCLHPKIKPFYDLSAKNCQLPPIKVCEPERIKEDINALRDSSKKSASLDLEIIRAEKFVNHKFETLKKKKSQMLNFYPFYKPNCLITDPQSTIEIFIRIDSSTKFAAIIGERLSKSVDPTNLFIQVQNLLRTCEVSYVEIINDAADATGIECILNGGFTPCAYFPAFKSQGGRRRDYVIFGRSFEYLCKPDKDTDRSYLEFFKEFHKVETNRYFNQNENITP